MDYEINKEDDVQYEEAPADNEYSDDLSIQDNLSSIDKFVQEQTKFIF